MSNKKTYKYHRSSFVIGKKADGTPERIWVRGKTKAECAEKLAEAKRLHNMGVSLQDITVADWAVRWLRTYKGNANEVQLAHYTAKLKRDILPVIGHMKIKEVRPSHLKELLNSYSGGKVGTVSKIRIAIKQLFADAVEEGLIERNPTTRLELPNLTENLRRPLNIAERLACEKVASSHKYGSYVNVMLYCGLRRGECIALEVGDVDLQKNQLTISKALNLTKNIGYIAGTKAANMRKIRTNNDVGVRIVPIPKIAIPIFSELCKGKQNGDILFPKQAGGYATKQACRYWWSVFSKECIAIEPKFSPEITPHFLRHTYATDLYAAGIDEKARKEFLGHSSSDVTDIYTKMSEDAFERARDLLNEYHDFNRWLFPDLR
ncbi:MAG: site-specific integrase [Firmicutes bacterium]|nr:site-specific integrase [Bacillota bacterium]